MKFLRKVLDFVRCGKIPLFYHGYSLYWNWLPRKCDCGDKECPGLRYFGYSESYYDGPIHMFGFWFFHFYIAVWT